MKNKILNACKLLLVLSVVTVACKKDDKKEKDVLTGTWTETPPQTYSQTLRFESDARFAMEYLHPDGAAKTTFRGKYVIKGDSLKINIQEMLELQSSGTVVRTPANSVMFEKGTFSVRDNVLTINYITYPADAPVQTQSKFKAILSQ
ncbi:hypothetical protein [Pedobacter sp. MR2016-24]|uniref:hypothetical protein n=1 Tax=Pedobacter sp. MR2016-24 TaxID=2994466 RepID=UPI0022450DF2|nr:hypothetical protein [Pedobacter sp. MR2016-24]MCX2484654.1 hypothetical protein [Pedobacter sp. MR2016-24]